MEIPQLYAFDSGHTPYHENFNNALRAIVELVQVVNDQERRIAALEAAASKPAGRK